MTSRGSAGSRPEPLERGGTRANSVRRRWLDAVPILRAWGQTPDEVAIRRPGERFLSAPLPLQPYANEHWELAWLSLAAYSRTHAGRKNALRTRAALQSQAVNPDPDDALQAAGWRLWSDFPDAELLEKLSATHLRLEIWEKQHPPTIAVTFGGTVFNNEADWRANLRWFIPAHRDEYTDVVQTFAPAFARKLGQRLQLSPNPVPADAILLSTGHSLGGGLAQQFAYSLPPESPKRVTKVYAFDPSPVTGFYSVASRLRNHNKRGLLIDRIYERGEVLALLRSLTSFVIKPTARNAEIRGVRYALWRAWNPIGAHSIAALAAKLAAAR
jgi:hypothetical protein